MFTLSELGSIAEFLGVFGVAASVFYLALQFKEAKAALERDAAMDMLRSYETTELMSIMYRVFKQPDNMSQR